MRNNKSFKNLLLDRWVNRGNRICLCGSFQWPGSSLEDHIYLECFSPSMLSYDSSQAFGKVSFHIKSSQNYSFKIDDEEGFIFRLLIFLFGLGIRIGVILLLGR